MTINNKHLFIVVASVVFVLVLSLPVGADRNRHGRDTDDQTPHATQAMVDQVTIAKKSPEVVITNIGDRYAIEKKATLIVGPDGKQVKYRQLKVPCEAHITYTNERNGRSAQKIVIKHIAQGASADFIYEKGH